MVISEKSVQITRAEYRRIKTMNRQEIEYMLSKVYESGASSEEMIRERKMAYLKARESLEQALDQKGIGPAKKAAIRERYKELMENV